MRLDEVVDGGERIKRRVPLPGDARFRRFENRKVRLRAAFDDDLVGEPPTAAGLLRHQPGAEVVRLGDRGGEPDRPKPRRERSKPRQPERKQVAALRDDERMQLVEDHRREPREEAPRILRRDEKRHLLRRRQQDVGRIELLPLALVDRRVAGARLKPDR